MNEINELEPTPTNGKRQRFLAIALAGACVDADPDIFFPQKGSVTEARAAKRICNELCKIKDECVDVYTDPDLDIPDKDGVVAGMSQKERERARVKRRREA